MRSTVEEQAALTVHSGRVVSMTDATLRAELRLAVHRLRSAHGRRPFAPVLHVGDLAGDAAATWTVDARETLDVGLRTDVVAALLDRWRSGEASAQTADPGEPPAVWLTRTGEPWHHDLDAAWLPPAERALASAEIPARCLVVVTRTGWYAWPDGERRTWRRLRVRR